MAIPTPPRRVLILACQTAAGEALVDAVRRRHAQGDAQFTLLVPAVAHGLHRVIDPEDQPRTEAQATLEAALPILCHAAGGAPVAGVIGCHEPFAAVQDALNLHDFDEVIVSLLPSRLSRWLRMDLPRKIAALGVPVTTVTASEAPKAALAAA
jgi:hypothetical protein